MYDYLLYFLVFSFLGWCAEVVFYIFKTGKLVNRGLAKGPFCPIYGVGICLCRWLLGSVESFILLVVFSMAIATAVELAVGVIMDRAVGRRLWDYSGERGNILGYVCPRFSLIWGVVCAITLKIIPLLDPFLAAMGTPFGYAATFALLMCVTVDSELQLLKRQRKTKR